jgi:hypothetical protein
VLPGISTEQLRSRLNRMVADGMLTRKRYREVPPRVDYELTERARELMPVLGALARWGYEWTWSEPRSSEAVDIGAIFRLAPGLITASDPSRTIEFTVTDSGMRYAVTISAAGVDLRERTTEEADARAAGNTQAWIAAFAPAHDRSGLEISGDAALVAAVLDTLAASGSQAAAGHKQAAA